MSADRAGCARTRLFDFETIGKEVIEAKRNTQKRGHDGKERKEARRPGNGGIAQKIGQQCRSIRSLAYPSMSPFFPSSGKIPKAIHSQRM